MENKRAIVIGAGLWGCVVAHELAVNDYDVDIYDRRNHIGGNIYDENIYGINVHKYGPHIFHTKHEDVKKYVEEFATFHKFTNTPMVKGADGKLYNLPLNMNTFIRVFNANSPNEVLKRITEDRERKKDNSLESYAISEVGKRIYHLLIEKYTKKQWGRSPKLLHSSILKRIPMRLTFNNNYFDDDEFQGIPDHGYTEMVENILRHKNIRIYLGNTLEPKRILSSDVPIFYSGSLDELFEYKFGKLEYRSLKFKTDVLNTRNYQGVAVINNAGDEKYTRTIEHRWFMKDSPNSDKTVVTREYPCEWQEGMVRYYPIDDKENSKRYLKYFDLMLHYKNIHVGGRLGSYKYMNMDRVIEEALELISEFIRYDY